MNSKESENKIFAGYNTKLIEKKPADLVNIDNNNLSKNILSISDAIDIISGKYRIKIVLLLMIEMKRFTEISKELNGITDRTLAKELKILEENQIIEKQKNDPNSLVVRYRITEHGKSLTNVLNILKAWGIVHRNKIVGN